ncbi:hypothetical protein MTsPCn5_03850 [Croceitalea sp. MTPC5]|nr:hypothetical protein MTsPCn5_03850 [Croceitalea sp. MTPC5]
MGSKRKEKETDSGFTVLQSLSYKIKYNQTPLNEKENAQDIISKRY